jgi:hypothetical protein
MFSSTSSQTWIVLLPTSEQAETSFWLGHAGDRRATGAPAAVVVGFPGSVKSVTQEMHVAALAGASGGFIRLFRSSLVGVGDNELDAVESSVSQGGESPPARLALPQASSPLDMAVTLLLMPMPIETAWNG